MKAFIWISVAALVAMVGCGGNDNAPEISMTEFMRGVGEAECSAVDRCDIDLGYLSAPVNRDRCPSDWARLMWAEGGFAYVPTAVYDPRAAAACVAKFKSQCPPGGEPDPEEWCPQAFGNCNSGPNPGWTTPVPQGGSCEDLYPYPKCAVGLMCTGTTLRTCQPRVPDGGACTGGDCLVGSDCNFPAGGICEPRPPYLPIQDPLDYPMGAICQPYNYSIVGLCNVGLVCDTATMTCGLMPSSNQFTCSP